jgi:hypothetical protein
MSDAESGTYTFDSGDYHQHNGLREVVLTTTEHVFAIDAIDCIPAVVAHWETLKGRPI